MHNESLDTQSSRLSRLSSAHMCQRGTVCTQQKTMQKISVLTVTLAFATKPLSSFVFLFHHFFLCYEYVRMLFVVAGDVVALLCFRCCCYKNRRSDKREWAKQKRLGHFVMCSCVPFDSVPTALK